MDESRWMLRLSTLCLTIAGLIIAGLVGACSPPPDDADPPLPSVEPEPPPADPIKGDDPRPRPAPAPGIACVRGGARTCDVDAEPLRCVAGSGGAVWMAAEACAIAHRCVPDHGCLPLPACTDVGLISCVERSVFACEAQPDGGVEWVHATRCPASIPCVNGRGCPNPFGVGTACSFVDPPRCTPDGRVMRCALEGIDAVWGAPEDCGVGTHCVAGQGCRAPEAHEPDTPTNPPKGQRRGWR